MSSRPHASGHLSARLLAQLATGEQPAAEVLERSLTHLASRCPTCRRRLEEYSIQRIVDRLGAGREAGIERAKARFADVARERAEAPERVAELLGSGELPGALASLAANPRFQTWGVAAYLQERAEAALEDAPREARTCALLAAAAAERLPRLRYGAGIVATAQAVAGAVLASALVQARRDVAGAESWLSRANDVARGASDASLVRAELALARMTIDLATGEWERAIRAFGQVERQVSQGDLPGPRLRGLLLLGRARRASGDSSQALGSFRLLAHFATGLPRQRDLGRWGSLEACRMLCELERFAGALTELERLPASGAFPDASRGRGHEAWLRGRALRGLGRAGDAECALETAWPALLRAGAELEAAGAALDLVDLHLLERSPGAAAGVLERISLLGGVEGFPRWASARLFRLHGAAARGELARGDVSALREKLLVAPAEEPEEREPVH